MTLASTNPATAPDFGTGYAVAAYVAIFVAFFGYLFYLHASHRRLRRDMQELERRTRQDGPVRPL